MELAFSLAGATFRKKECGRRGFQHPAYPCFSPQTPMCSLESEIPGYVTISGKNNSAWGLRCTEAQRILDHCLPEPVSGPVVASCHPTTAPASTG